MELAQLGSSLNQAADNDFAAAVSRSLQPHDPHHRYSLTAGNPETGNYEEATSNLTAPFPATFHVPTMRTVLHQIEHRLEIQ